MKADVGRVHELGMKYLLWYAVPFVGIRSKAYDRFAGKLLGTIDALSAGVLDPRFPDVREHIVSTYEQAMRAWDLDGFKLDFIDSFAALSWGGQELAAGQDDLSLPETGDPPLAAVPARLEGIKPDVMIEVPPPFILPPVPTYAHTFSAPHFPYTS